jgi:hypothetical protein
MMAMCSNKIQVLNDRFRQTFLGGRVMMTAGVAAMADNDRRTLLDRVRRFDGFSSENDPYGEHDFGSIDLGDCRYFWKIEYYDRTLTCGYADACRRVLNQQKYREAATRANWTVSGHISHSSTKSIRQRVRWQPLRSLM